MPPPPPVKLVVFDWAGTTVDFGSCAPAGAFVRAFATRGVTVTAEAARGPMGLHKKEHLRVMLSTAAVADAWRAAHGRDWTEADLNDLYERVTPLQVAAAAQSRLVPGLLDCVAVLRRRGLRIAATTGYFRAAAEACRAAARAQGYEPDFCIGADEVPAGRPAPWMIVRCMTALGVHDPALVVKVGDTIPDVEEGLNAGCRSVGVVDSSSLMGLTEAEFAALPDADRSARRAAVRAQFLAAGAHGVIDTLAELPGWIDGSTIGSPSPAA